MSGNNPSDFGTSVRSLRFFQEGTTTDAFVEAIMGGVKGFGSGGAGAGNIEVQNTSNNALYISFDGTTIHGRVNANTTKLFRNRYESTLFLKSAVGGSSATFLVHAW